MHINKSVVVRVTIWHLTDVPLLIDILSGVYQYNQVHKLATFGLTTVPLSDYAESHNLDSLTQYNHNIDDKYEALACIFTYSH